MKILRTWPLLVLLSVMLAGPSVSAQAEETMAREEILAAEKEATDSLRGAASNIQKYRATGRGPVCPLQQTGCHG